MRVDHSLTPFQVLKKALKTLTTFVSEEDYDENNPRLVKTDDPDTSDRVMVASFQGVDGYNYYNNDTFTGKPDVYGGWGAKYDYQYKSSGLTTNQNAIHSFIDNISVAGGTQQFLPSKMLSNSITLTKVAWPTSARPSSL